MSGKALSPPSCNSENKFSSQESQRCCYQCPAGFTPKAECPTDHRRDCVKQCEEGQYLNYDNVTPQCEHCLSCKASRHLVQKAPCTHNSSGVCECRPGMYCQTKILNTCARCSPLTICKPDSRVKIKGTSDQDTVCEKCPPGTFSEEDSLTETCKPLPVDLKVGTVPEETETTTQEGLGVTPPLDITVLPAMALGPTGSASILTGPVSSNVLDTNSRQPINESRGLLGEASRKEEKDATSLAAALLFVFLLLAILVVLWKKRACKKWIVPHKAKMFNQVEIYATGTPAPAEKGLEETDLMQPESLTESSSSSPSETEEAPSLDLERAELLQVDGGVLMEPAVRSHTSNCIENVYILRADKVILGSVSEVPAGKACPARGEKGMCGAQEAAEELEADMHYPEQETEFCPESDIITPVEEEWEFPGSVLASEKPLGIQEETCRGAS